MSKPVLSVCIPTFNRDKYLDTAIASVAKQINKYCIKDDIEICISDNASTDNTDEIVKKWKNTSDIKIVYHRNDKNLGADRNFLKVIDLSSGKYCWFLSSDDLAMETSITTILEDISKNDFDIYLYSRQNFVSDTKTSFMETWLDKEFIVSNDNLKIYISNMNKLGGIFSYISSIVFERNKWIGFIKDNPKNVEQFVGSQYVHAFVLLNMIKRGSIMKSMNTPIVYNRIGNSGFLEKSNYFKRIKLDYSYLPMANTIYGSEIENEIKKLLKRKNTFLKLLRAKYYLDESEKRSFYNFIKEYDLANPILIKTFPNSVIKILLIMHSLLNELRATT